MEIMTIFKNFLFISGRRIGSFLIILMMNGKWHLSLLLPSLLGMEISFHFLYFLLWWLPWGYQDQAPVSPETRPAEVGRLPRQAGPPVPRWAREAIKVENGNGMEISIYFFSFRLWWLPLVRTGQWFDGLHSLISVSRPHTPPHVYAPEYFVKNEEKFDYLLTKPHTG